MKIFIFILVASLLIGCGKKHEGTATASREQREHKEGEEKHEEDLETLGPTFKEGQGLFLPEETSVSIGLKTVEVSERKIAPQHEVSLRVYKTKAGRALASGFVSPKEAALLRIGMNGVVKTNGTATSATAKITTLDRATEKASGQIEVLAEISNTTSHFTEGDFLSASFAIGEEATVVSIPRAALLETANGKSVYAMNGDRLVRVPVQTGADDGAFVEITDGLYAGDTVALQPIMTLWLTELAAVKGGQACCVAPPKGK